jgi:hypothetical protein
MAKLRVLLPARAEDGAGRADTALGRAVLDAVPGVAALSVCVADAAPATPPWQRPGEPASPDAAGFAAVLDAWGSDAALDQVQGVLAARRPGAVVLRVAETIEKDTLPRPASGPAPGIKFLSLMTFHPDLSADAARRLWAHHAQLALRVHVGMARYVRDWVVRPAESAVQGIAELHFPDAHTMMMRWFDSAAGRAAIVHDVGHFLLRATRLYTTEHVLK